MKGLTPKFDDTSGADGKLTANEFEDMRKDSQNAVIASGQTLTVNLFDDNDQMTKAMSVGGRRIARGNNDTASIGDIVLPDNSGGPITIFLPTVGLFENAQVEFEQVFDQPFSEDTVTFDGNGNTIGLTATGSLVDSDGLRGGFRWDGAKWLPFKSEQIGATP